HRRGSCTSLHRPASLPEPPRFRRATTATDCAQSDTAGSAKLVPFQTATDILFRRLVLNPVWGIHRDHPIEKTSYDEKSARPHDDGRAQHGIGNECTGTEADSASHHNYRRANGLHGTLPGRS